MIGGATVENETRQGGARIDTMDDRRSGGVPPTMPVPRREPTGPFLNAVRQLAPVFVPPAAALVDACELSDDSAGYATYTTGDHTAYHLTVQRQSNPPDLGEILLSAVRVELPSGSTRFEVKGSEYVQIILTRPSGVAVTVTIPFLGEKADQGRALSNLAAQVTETLDVPSTDEIGLAGLGKPVARA